VGRRFAEAGCDGRRFPRRQIRLKANTRPAVIRRAIVATAGANYFFTNLVKGEKPPAQEDPARANFKTKADVVAYVKKSTEDGAAAIKAKGDAGIAGMMVDPFANQQVRVFDWAYGFIEHMGEHYGQLAVYYRVAGLVPPESRPKK
jgi:hypothetical protein